MRLESKEKGAAVFTPLIEVGLTKEGESFAAGSTAAERPRCIVTGGAATLTVSYQGQSYPICCTGCRDEFNENPQKYLKKLASRTKAAATPEPTSLGPRGSAGSKTRSRETSRNRPLKRSRRWPAEAGPRSSRPGRRSRTSRRRSRRRSTRPPPGPRRRLRMAQNLEKSGKADLALKSYRQLVKDYPGSPQAKTAAERIKALEKRVGAGLPACSSSGLPCSLDFGPIRMSRPMVVVQIPSRRGSSR